MALKNILCVFRERARVSLFILLLACVVQGQVRYSIPEEMDRGSVVGNIAEDLGIDVKRLKSGRARIVAGDSSRYVELNTDKGILSVNERIDRELLCEKISPCSFSFEIILEIPIQLFEVIVEIMDVNDHAPVFPKNEINIEISETALPGARFLLDSAFDPDVGVNTIQSYSLRPTDNFVLKPKSRSDGNTDLEMILQTPVDREMQEELSLILTAVDGGNPQKSGDMKINIKILDANDNAPVFTKKLYRAAVSENSLKGTLVTKVSATDADKGVNGEVTYAFRQVARNSMGLFEIDGRSGEIFVLGNIDFEKANNYELKIEAKDHGGFTDSCDVIVDVIDVNDNIPVISVTSFTNPISESALPGTTVAVINVKDSDSDENGQVTCAITQDIPFTIKSSLRNYYTLLSDEFLDRESVSEYNITIIATDEGSPPLSSKKTLHLKVSDVNDNPPIFQKRVYFAHIYENNSPSVSIFAVSATDADCCQNARVSYIVEDTEVSGARASSLVSVNSESGIIYATRSFDFEQLRQLEINIRAQDGGSPPLSSNVTVKIFIQDQNDNAPQILYPLQTGVSLVAEMVPRSADVGYLVTKVVAVDVDSGQNAWLSYKLLKAPDRALFEVGLQNGEIRTVRPVTDKDAVKQRLTVVVEDNGQPFRSATVNVNVAVADSFPEVFSEFTDFTHDKDYNDNLTFYLVLALAVVSFLFVSSLVVIISVKIYRWRQSRLYYQSNLPVIPYYPPLYADVAGTGTLQHAYSYDVCKTTDSRKSDIKYFSPCSQSIINLDPSGAQTLQHVLKKEECIEDSGIQKTPSDWHFSQNQRPGTSGGRPQGTQERWHPHGNSRAGPRPEDSGAVSGTSPWPNPPTEAEQLQALMAAANEVSDATATLGQRYNPQFTLQNVPDYRQNVYIPGSTATLTANQQQPPQPALPQPPPPADAPKPAQTPASKKKSTKKDKK
ncbi:protocadherin gamma-A11-like isoform X19 [Anguilla rostrata]|uniref:protocadherin gamma-A11-like isoform X19 n=1 Tax=Anguilla rostrata TaxID=7938 RepID=UPI0030CA90FD